jgi:hypothetical protein
LFLKVSGSIPPLSLSPINTSPSNLIEEHAIFFFSPNPLAPSKQKTQQPFPVAAACCGDKRHSGGVLSFLLFSCAKNFRALRLFCGEGSFDELGVAGGLLYLKANLLFTQCHFVECLSIAIWMDGWMDYQVPFRCFGMHDILWINRFFVLKLLLLEGNLSGSF